MRPVEVRELLLHHAPQFGDYGQHDTQEFLRFLLDGLHNELNLVTDKVTTSMSYWPGLILVAGALPGAQGHSERERC